MIDVETYANLVQTADGRFRQLTPTLLVLVGGNHKRLALRPYDEDHEAHDDLGCFLASCS